MMKLFAQPLDFNTAGFHFDSLESYASRVILSGSCSGAEEGERCCAHRRICRTK